jgi:hypothetical protein
MDVLLYPQGAHSSRTYQAKLFATFDPPLISPRDGTSYRSFTSLSSCAYHELPRYGFIAPPDPWFLENPDSCLSCAHLLALSWKLGFLYRHDLLEGAY